MKNKQILASFLTAVMAFSSLPINVFAEELPKTLEDSKNNTAEAVLTQEATIFSATVPTALPINVDANNNVTVATNATVVNDSYGPILVTGITLNNKNGWERVEVPEQKVGKKQFSFDISLESMSIAAKSNTKIVYNSKVSPQKDALNNVPVQDVIFTIGWNSVNHSEISTPKDKIVINEQTKLSVPVAEGETILWKNSNPSVAKIIAKTRSANPSEIVAGGEVEIKALNLGTTTITAIDSNGNTFTKEIVVVENSLQSIYIVTQPTKSVYRDGEIFDPSGMVVKAVYLNGDEYELPLYFYSKAPLIEDQQAIEVSYTEKGVSKTASVPISVGKAKMAITIQPSVGGIVTTDKTEAAEGELVIITASPNTDYVFKSISVNGTPITGNTFVMPNKEVTVSAIFDKIIYPVIGTKFEDATYEYSFGQFWSVATSKWHTSAGQVGWGVKLKDKKLSGKISAPLTEIQGCPVTNMSNMFYYSAATTLDLSNFDTSNVTNMSNMFYGSAATTLDLSSFDTSKVTDMIGMFYYSTATTLDLSNFNTSNVTSMSNMFRYSAATTLDLSSFDTSNVTDMYQMFNGSPAITLDLSSFDTSNVTDMREMFNSSAATTLDLSNFNTSNVTSMSNMFRYSAATTLDLSNFDTSNVTDMYQMFKGSSAITLDLSSFNTPSVTNMYQMFQDSAAKTGYARTTADAAKLNATLDKPAALTFVVK